MIGEREKTMWEKEKKSGKNKKDILERLMDKEGRASQIDAERRERSDQTFRWCGLVKKSLPMKNALSLEFIHRCIYNACPQNE